MHTARPVACRGESPRHATARLGPDWHESSRIARWRHAAESVDTPTMSPQKALSKREVLLLPVRVPMWPDAARAFGMSRTAAYSAAKAGSFPCPVHRIGSRCTVNRADILTALGMQ